MPAVITVVRHGETKMNKAQIVQSRTPGELTQRGVKMAQSLGKHLANEKFTHVFTSDLKRCHDTTLNILKQSKHSQPEPKLTEVLRERDFGDLEFQSCETVREIVRQLNLPEYEVPIPGGESYEAVIKRCEKFFQELCQLVDSTNESDEELNILVVSHGCWIMIFLDYLFANPDLYELHNYDHGKIRQIPIINTGNTKFHLQKLENVATINNNAPPKRSVKFCHYHCVKHLEHMDEEE